eukprot:4166566-Amphidinium_carterae.1
MSVYQFCGLGGKQLHKGTRCETDCRFYFSATSVSVSPEGNHGSRQPLAFMQLLQSIPCQTMEGWSVSLVVQGGTSHAGRN